MALSRNPETLSRHEFLRKLGLSGAALMAVYFSSSVLTSCKNESDLTPTGSGLAVDFTLNLDEAANADLKNNGGFVVVNEVVIARTNEGTYAAVTVVCSHAGLKQVIYSTDRFLCTAHGALYDNTGKGLNLTGSNGLTLYQTTLTGNQLRVFSKN